MPYEKKGKYRLPMVTISLCMIVKDEEDVIGRCLASIVKNHAGMQWIGAVHEVISTAGKVEHSECAVTHQKLHPSDPDRNLRIFEKQIEGGIKLDPRQQFHYGRELYYHKRYEDAIRVFQQFLDEDARWMPIFIHVFSPSQTAAFEFYEENENK